MKQESPALKFIPNSDLVVENGFFKDSKGLLFTGFTCHYESKSNLYIESYYFQGVCVAHSPYTIH